MKLFFGEKIRLVPKWVWILGVIMLVGIFLRAYDFHDWLHFGSDQARDAMLIENVLNNTASWPLLGADASNTHFKLGPIYYYFQIISGEIFGSDVAALAYPDLFFSILAIPLFYFLIRKYFRENLSLALTGLYTISFYTIEYSRFAWNPNPIPFFVMLYLYSVLEFLENREKTKFLWILLLGASLGVGIQLHTLLLLLLPVLSLLVFLFLLQKNWKMLGKVAIIILVALAFNFGQIKSEWETGGANAQRFLIASTDRSQSGMNRFIQNLQADGLSHSEANIHILSSLGDTGNFIFLKLLKYPEKMKNHVLYAVYVIGIAVSILFSVVGYGLLFVRMRKETVLRRKYFLVLILFYSLLSFLILLSVARDAPLRYFIHTTFIPFILLGLWIDWLREKLAYRFFMPTIVFLFAFLSLANAHTITIEAHDLSTGTRGDSGFVVLGEAERMVDHMIEKSFPDREAIFFGGAQYASTYYKSLRYLAEQKDFKLMYTDRKTVPTSERSYFFMNKALEDGDAFETSHYVLIESANFGRMSLHQLKKQ